MSGGLDQLERLRAAYEKARDELLAERTPDGHWVGELSSSALATATAVSALAVVRAKVQSPKSKVQGQVDHSVSTLDLGPWTFDTSVLNELIRRGVAWLVRQQNDDGGFGDTDLSHSNIATTMLVVAALHLAGVAEEQAELIRRANGYIDAEGRLEGLRERYGIDKTFVVPIMANLALAGLVEWREVDPLPFELACVPQSWYRFVGMPVVSYAIPALVAIGQARFFHAPPRNPITRCVRSLSVTRSLQVLRRMQPDSGGYLEATPLTSFVVMSLASKGAGFRGQGSADLIADEVICEGVKFLVNSVRPDGSWPIDTNLATWNTTLAINALAGGGEDVAELLGPQCLDWLLSCQHTKRHAFTGANPGGFGWSDLSGAVPDADDTPGAMLAISSFLENEHQVEISPTGEDTARIGSPIGQGIGWLHRLENRDGGWPTFCRGWGKLPFDRSGVDITAHVLRAFGLSLGSAVYKFDVRVYRRFNRGFDFIKKRQHRDGAWSPLWFGNQDHPDEDNPVYGTAKVLMAYRDLGLMESPEARRGVAWLVANQNADGGWGSGVWKLRIADCGLRIGSGAERSEENGVESLGKAVPSTANEPETQIANPKSKIQNPKSSVEETALAVEALLAAAADAEVAAALERGLAWLVERVEHGEHRQPAPIGFYFAKLWYYERLYPLTFTVAALGRACRQFAHRADGPISDLPTESRAP